MKYTFQRITRLSSSFLLVAMAAGLAFAAETMPTMSKSDVKELIAKANSPEDHHRLAAYFTQKADYMDAEATEHEELSKAYAKHPPMGEMKRPMSGNSAKHCANYVQAAHKAAAEDRALAAAHENMANMAHK